MSALSLVSSWGGDAMPDGVTIDRPVDATVYSSRQTAERRAARIRANVAELVGDLVDAWREHDDEALGFVSFAEFTAWLFGDVSRVSIPVEARRELVAGMTERDGLSVRKIADALGVSKSLVADDRKIMLHPQALDDARIIDAEVVEPLDPFRGLSARWEVLARVAAQAERGLTSVELDAELDAPLGTATGSLSKLAARGLIEIGSLDEARANRRPYRVTEPGRARLAELLTARDAAEGDVEG